MTASISQPAGTPGPRPTTLSPLKHRLFLAIWFGSLLANFGNAVQSVGAAWLLTELRQSADMIALVQSAASLPIMLLALPAGAFADVHDRRRVMLGAQLSMLAVSILLALLASQHQATPWAVIGLTVALACGVAFFNPAIQASIGDIVPRAELAGAVALNILAFNVARSLGPALGGVIVAVGGSSMAFVINAASYVAVIVVLLLWRPKVSLSGVKSPMGKAIGDGLRFVFHSSPVRTIIARAFTFTMAGSAAWALMPLVARDMIHGGSVVFGLLLGALGVGAVIGAASATWFRQRYSSEAIIRGAGLIYGCGCLLVALKPGLWPTLALLVVAGAGWVQALSGFSVAGQLWSPRAIVGRVTAIVSSVTFGGIALGSWLWGHVASGHGIQMTIAASGALMVVLPLIGLWLPMPRHEDAADR
ncbi:MAG TPA: MFS transporter [Sphingomonadaceae bacterium]|nr:MFS transporter [Sphingomonadaceae bacterium]